MKCERLHRCWAVLHSAVHQMPRPSKPQHFALVCIWVECFVISVHAVGSRVKRIWRHSSGAMSVRPLTRPWLESLHVCLR
jgi:hypothetical protein